MITIMQSLVGVVLTVEMFPPLYILIPSFGLPFPFMYYNLVIILRDFSFVSFFSRLISFLVLFRCLGVG